MIHEPNILSYIQGGKPVNLMGLRILIVDDNQDGADSLSDLLAICGAMAFTRYNGQSAVAAVAQFQPDIVILDVTMPVMDGCEAASRIRIAGAPIPFLIALSGQMDDRTRERVAQCGFDFHFNKPMNPGDLLHALASIGRIRATRAAAHGLPSDQTRDIEQQ